MDMTATIAPKTDQQNYDDYLTGPRTVTISGVRKGSVEQPVNVELAEYPGKPFKPNKSMRRVLVSAWGADATAYVGRKLTLFGNPGVSYGGKAVGGIEISHMSHIDKPLTFALTATRGQRKNFTVKPLVAVLAEPATEPWIAQWQAIQNALGAAGYEGDGPKLLTVAGQVIGSEWQHPNQISAEDAQKILAAVREDNNEEKS